MSYTAVGALTAIEQDGLKAEIAKFGTMPSIKLEMIARGTKPDGTPLAADVAVLAIPAAKAELARRRTRAILPIVGGLALLAVIGAMLSRKKRRRKNPNTRAQHKLNWSNKLDADGQYNSSNAALREVARDLGAPIDWSDSRGSWRMVADGRERFFKNTFYVRQALAALADR